MLANRASIAYFLSISFILHVCIKSPESQAESKWEWDGEKTREKIVETHQLNTNFILWIWFSKLNTPATSDEPWTKPLWMEPTHLVRHSLDNSSQQQTNNPIQCIWRMLMLNAGTHTHQISILYAKMCLLRLYLSFLSFYFSLFISFSSFAMFFISGRAFIQHAHF